MKVSIVAADSSSILSALAVIVLFTVSRFLVKLYYARSKILELKRQGLPMPPYHPIFGHLLFAYKITSKLPKDAHPNYLPDMVRRELPSLGPVYYLDTWPFGPQMLIVASPSSLYQVTQEHSLGKYHAMKSFLKPITDGSDIVTMEGEMWKTWRGIFNPGFSAGHLSTLTSSIVEETTTFCDLLEVEASAKSRKVLRMKDLTDFLALDIIGRVVLDVKLDSQRRSNPLVNGLRSQIRWLMFGGEVNPFVRFNPFRPLILWYNSQRMDRYVSRELDNRMNNFESVKQSKSIMDLALSAYLSNRSESQPIEGGMDTTFRKFAMSQIKQFLFSGHDTTSSSICYLYYTLAQNPLALRHVQDEHDEVFGTNLDKTTSQIIQTPPLLNQLPYTLAVIKETLRLYPAVSSTRAGEPGFMVRDDLGRQFPTDDFLVWANPQVIQRDPTYWPKPDEFIPERWLVSSDDPMHPIKGTWRPFEYGPRNCIGQELAVIEMKIIMIMTLRKFSVKLAYSELDCHVSMKGVRTVYGERGYQILRAQPSDDLPCWVTKMARQ